ncbi:MAG TPA: serine hydrolase domain-containing protein [Candidatus Acidoferrum sp.]|nr:serine hydrolase domain-containing protein [Candidatus Acidoferrum sp.]
MRRILLPAIALSVLFAGPAALAVPQAEQKKEELPHAKTLEELQKAMKDVVEKEHVTGAGVALVSNGQLLWCGGIGKADLSANRGVTCDTEFRVGSISKTFVALALLKLEEEEKINLHARLQDVAPEIPMKNRWASSNPVRIVNLLEHTAGFDDMEFTEFYNRHGPENYPLLDVFKRFQEPQNVRWPPGTRFSYSNPDYGIAGYLIEKTTGQPFDAFIQQNILAPLEITVGDFRLTGANRAALAQGYEGNPPRAVPYRNIYLRPAGDLKASPGELAKLVQFFLRRGRAGDVQLVKPESIARMEYPETVSSSKNDLRLGYGLGNYTESTGGVITHGHDGAIDGFISSYRYMPEQNWGYVVLLNSTVSGKALGDLNLLAIDFLSKDFPKLQQPTISLTAQELKKFSGYYEPRAPRSQVLAFLRQPAAMKIGVRNGNLECSSLFGKSRETLLPVGKNLFRGEKEPEATAVFFPDASGRMIYVRSGENGMPYGERVFPLWIFARLVLLGASLVVMGSALPYALFWGLLLLLGRFIRKWKRAKHLRVRVVPFFAVLSLLAGALAFTKSLGSIGTWTFYSWSIIVWLASVLFVVLSLVSLALAVSVPRKEIHNWVRIHSLLVSLACCIVTLFFSSWHLIGLRLWAP